MKKIPHEYNNLMPLKEISAKIGKIENGSYLAEIRSETPSQKLDKKYEECGTVFLYTHDFFLKGKKKTYPFIISDYRETIDIDTKEDFLKAREIIQE